MPKYRIPCSWQMYGVYEIDADSFDEAVATAEDSELPTEASFVMGSFEMETEFSVILDSTGKWVEVSDDGESEDY